VNVIQILNCVRIQMSCGNRFQCGLSKPTRTSFRPDRPSNPELHNENQKRLGDLLKAREEMDKGLFTPVVAEEQHEPPHADMSKLRDPMFYYPDTKPTTFQQDMATVVYTISTTTPWRVPSASDFEKNNKLITSLVFYKNSTPPPSDES
jgi:hypothetical protein